MFDRLCPPSTRTLTKQADHWLVTLRSRYIVRDAHAVVFRTAVRVDRQTRLAVWQIRFEEPGDMGLFAAVFQTKQRLREYQE